MRGPPSSYAWQQPALGKRRHRADPYDGVSLRIGDRRGLLDASVDLAQRGLNPAQQQRTGVVEHTVRPTRLNKTNPSCSSNLAVCWLIAGAPSVSGGATGSGTVRTTPWERPFDSRFARDLRHRIGLTRWSDEVVGDWSQGTSQETLRKLMDHWDPV